MSFSDFGSVELSLRANTTKRWHRMDNEKTFSTVKDTYGEEDVEYTFNSLGFRSSELEDDQWLKVLYVGCSVTEGMGLPVKHTWSKFLNDSMAEQVNYTPKLYSIAKSGISIDACLRYLYITVEQKGFKPDLVLMLAPPISRNELFIGREGVEHIYDFNPAFEPEDFSEKERYRATMNRFSVLQRAQEAIRNLLFIKWYLQAKRIPFYFSSWFQNISHDELGRSFNHDMLFSEMAPPEIQERFIKAPMRFETSVNVFPQKIARDGMHFGPNSHLEFANGFWEQLKDKEDVRHRLLCTKKQRFF